MNIPCTIAALGPTIRVRYAERGELPKGAKGFWRTTGEATGEIVIRRGLPVVGRLVIVTHELLHAIDDMMAANGTTKRRIPHAWIEGGAFGLAAMLVHLGAIKGVTPAMWRRFAKGLL